MSCNYTFKDKQYTSKSELIEAVLNTEISAPLNEVQTFEVQDDWAKITMQEDAKRVFGTDEFLSFTETDGVIQGRINQKALNEATSNIREFTKENGDTVLIDIEKLAEDVRRNPNTSIPNIPEVHAALFKNMLQGFEEYVSREVLQGTPDEVSLKEKLYDFANRFGITVKTLEEYHTNYGGDVQAVADIFDRIIALSNENDLNQFSEEVAHFAVEYFNDTNKIDALLATIDQTNEYKANKLRYVTKYAKMGYKGEQLERKVRKEVLGKILGQKIQDNFAGSESTSFFETLRQLWEGFLGLFNKDTNQAYFREFGALLDEISMNVLQANPKSFDVVRSKEVYFSLDVEQLAVKSKLEGLIDTLEEGYKAILDKKVRGKKVQEIKQIQEALLDTRFLEAVQATTTLITNDVRRAKDAIETSKRDNPDNPYLGIGDHQLTSIQIAQATLTQHLDTLSNILAVEKLSPTSPLTKKEAESIEKDIKQARDLYNSIASDIDTIIVEKTETLTDKFLDYWGTTPDQRKAFKDGVAKIEDVNGLMRWIKAPVFMGNSLFMLIASKLKQAETVTHEKLMGITRQFENYLKDKNITHEDTKSLFDGHYMMNGIRAEGMESYDKARDEFNDTWNAKRDTLTKANATPDALYNFDVQRSKASALFNAKYTETPYVKKDVKVDDLKVGDLVTSADGRIVGEFVKVDNSKVILNNELGESVSVPKTTSLKSLEGFVAVHPDAVNAIKNFNAQKYSILRKYRRGSGYDFTHISAEDLTEYKALLTEFRREQSEYTETGARKTGRALTIAKDIKKYYQDKKNIYGSENESNLTSEFEADRKAIQDEVTPEQYQRWLNLNANFTYPSEVFDSMEEGGSILEDGDILAINYFGNEPVAQMRLATIQANLGLSDTEVSKLTIADLHLLLKEKRQKLVAPYKEVGKFNQIQGDVIDANNTLADEITNVTSLMSYFKMSKNESQGDVTFEPVANDAFKRKYDSFKGNVRAQQQFLQKHAVTKIGGGFEYKNGYPVPKTYYFKTYRIINSQGQEVGKKYIPSFTYIMSKAEQQETNPDYSYALSEKGVPQFTKWFKDDFKNEEFFDKFGIDANKDFYGQQGATRNQDLFGFRNLLLEQKAKSDKEESIWGQYFTLPAVPPSDAELIINNPKNVVGTVKGILAKKILLRSEDDTLGIGESTTTESSQKKFGFTKINYRNKIVARYRGKMTDTKELSQDITYMYLSYLQEGISANERAKLIPQINMIIDRLERTPLQGNQSYKDSNIKKVMDDWLSTNLYGQSMDSGYIFNLGNTKISTSKLSRALYGFTQLQNLGLNTPVAVTGFLNATMQTVGEKYINFNVGAQSVDFGFAEAARLTPEWMKAIGDTNPNAKIPQLLRFAQMDTVNELSQGIALSRAYRVGVKSASPMAHLQITGDITSAYSTIMVYDAYRLVPMGFQVLKDGVQVGLFNTEAEAKDYAEKNNGTVSVFKNFVTQRQYLDQASKMYSDYNRDSALEFFNNSKNNSFYNFLEQNPDNSIKINTSRLQDEGYYSGVPTAEWKNKTDVLTSLMNRNVKDFHSEKEGQLAPEERAAISRNALASHLMLHRGWMVRQIHQRLNKRHYNPFMGTDVEGSYTTLMRLTREGIEKENGLRDVLELYGSIASFGLYGKGFDKLDELERSNVKRVIVDQVLIIASASLFLLATALAGGDDMEDSALAQYTAYIATRNFNEIMSTQLPYVLSEYSALLKEPVPGLAQAEGFFLTPYNLMVNAYNNDEVKSGNYKGAKKWQRDLWKFTMLKNVRGFNNPDNWKGKTNWMRNQSWVMKNTSDIIFED